MNHLATVISLCLALPVLGQEGNSGDPANNCQMHDHATHQAVVESRGDQAMGFPHDKTTHHFLLLPDGGLIEVSVSDPADSSNTAAIRSHLRQIASMFGAGDFSAPMFIHDGVPPGVTTMKLMKSAIHYAYKEVPSGGKIRMESTDPIAVASIHDFMRFQIKEHQTHDSLAVQK